jgi:predicted branched-subunit amino acid permease
VTTTDLAPDNPDTSAAPEASAALHRPAELRRAAVRDIAALSPGVVPFGLMLGVTVMATASGAASALVGAAWVFGGSAQLTTITVLHLGAGLVAAVLSGAVVNARILLYGAALEPFFRGQPLWFRLLAPGFIQDQTYLSATGRSWAAPADFRRYWGWLGASLLVVWTASVGLGLLLAPVLPPLPHLALVGTALFIAMLVPRLVDATSLAGAAVAALTAVAVAQILPELGILVGAAAGVATAVLVSARRRP